MNLVKPLEVFSSQLNTVQAPSRYLGGEYGAVIKTHEAGRNYYNVGIAFPDLYEIGMSNLAVKIIYNALNSFDNIRCERVFSPDLDFEALLREKNVPLYTLETGMPLKELDFIGFSIGYELGITQVLAMLDLGGIPLLAKDRRPEDPIVIAGGCGVTNPAPFSDFFDAVMIGEAEDALFDTINELALMKEKGESRECMLKHLSEKSFIWTKDKGKIAYRAVQGNFGLVPSKPSWYPLPSIKPVQDHGVVEIMRGCPNGCRFCHAGMYYRPTRVKNRKLIIDEIDHLVFDAGYREVSLNSLSSADFPDIEGLLDELNQRYKGYNVSFQLPSLKVNSLSLPILEKLSTVRKSGLTFAVETPEELWQLSLNKEVYAQHLESIILEAKARGWSSAKFYFMIGLPVGDYFGDANTSGKTEEEVIVDFLLDIQKRTRIQCNVNVGVFIPKPHTAYQWVRQLTPEAAQKKFDYLYQHLPRGKFKLGRHNLDTTVLEGLMSRGDSRVGKLILSAYNKGIRFDAWDEKLKENKSKWQEVFSECGWNVRDYVYKNWSLDEELPWDGVSLGVSKQFYRREWERSLSAVLTPRCMSNCDHPCGICSEKKQVSVHKAEEIEAVTPNVENRIVPVVPERPESNIPILYRVIFSFKRSNGGEYMAYLSQVELFHKAIIRSGLPFVFTSGFNPLPRIEFASAMSLGISSLEEVASACLYDEISSEKVMQEMNRVLPPDFALTKVFVFPVTTLRKRESLSQGLWGGRYEYAVKEPSFEKTFSDFARTFCAEKNISYTQEKGKWYFDFPSSDKVFRTELETRFEKKWYQLLYVTKVQTLANPQVKGWTANDERLWRSDSSHFEKDTSLLSETDSNKPVSFFDLYKKIAQVNADLISARAGF